MCCLHEMTSDWTTRLQQKKSNRQWWGWTSFTSPSYCRSLQQRFSLFVRGIKESSLSPSQICCWTKKRPLSRHAEAGPAALLQVEIHQRGYAFKHFRMWRKLIQLQKYFQLHIRRKKKKILNYTGRNHHPLWVFTIDLQDLWCCIKDCCFRWPGMRGTFTNHAEDVPSKQECNWSLITR